MRHLVATKKLSRDTDHRKALMRNLAAGLFISGRIKTTLPKARFVRKFVERIITIAKRNDLTARRQVIAMIQDRFIVNTEETDVKRDKSFNIKKGPLLVTKIFSEIAPKYANVNGGYTRIIHLADRRIGDSSELCYLELIDPTQKKSMKKTRTGGNRKKKAQSRIALYNKLIKGKKDAAKEEPKAESNADSSADKAE
jgi:large subunit ribosomal protein L17